MKKILCCLLLLLFSGKWAVAQQTFQANSFTAFDMDAGSASICTTVPTPTTTPNAIRFNVSGVGVLNATNALAAVRVLFDATCGGNLRDIRISLKAPDGTCSIIYRAGIGTTVSGTADITFRSSATCLNTPNTTDYVSADFSNSSTTTSGTTGMYAAYDGTSAINLTTAFTGVNANGTWTMIFNETAVNAPCITNAFITFGDPTIVDNTTLGNNCSAPILLSNNQSFCAQTTGKTNSVNMPQWVGPGANTFNTAPGACQWNAANNNDVWIKYTATITGTACLAVSGLDVQLQSIVVTDPNNDGDNDPCTCGGCGNGMYWTVASCPRNAIYGATTGADANHQHCFSTVAGRSYFLVVDGNGGAESSFYVSHISNTPVLPAQLSTFHATPQEKSISLFWSTTTEKNTQKFVVEKSADGENFEEIGEKNAALFSNTVTNYNYIDTRPQIGDNYFRIRTVDMDGVFSYSNMVNAYFDGNDPLFTVKDNKNANNWQVALNNHDVQFVDVVDMMGNAVYHLTTQGNPTVEISTQELPNGIYILSASGNFGTKSKKVVLYR